MRKFLQSDNSGDVIPSEEDIRNVQIKHIKRTFQSGLGVLQHREVDSNYKLYKIKYFTNSDAELFGHKIKREGKSHIDSHNKVSDVLERLQKDKSVTFGSPELTITYKTKTTVCPPVNSYGFQ